LSGSLVIRFKKVWNTTVPAQKATVATKVANVNNTGGNIVLDCLSQGAHGVSIPKPRINTAAPVVANPPIKNNAEADFFRAIRDD